MAVSMAPDTDPALQRTPRIAILFAQFAPYHADRIEAAARALTGRATVVGVEVAQASETYAWSPSGEMRGAEKRVLFSGERYEKIGTWRRFRAQYSALKDCATTFVGIGYNEPDVIALAWALRLRGRRVVVMTDSKFDDMPRSIRREWIKALLLRPFHAALVAGHRQVEYFRFLGFDRRRVLIGYDTVDLARVRAQAGGVAAPDGVAYAERPFVFVGRFVPKKNLGFLIDAYHTYRNLAGGAARRLVLVGGGEEDAALRAQIAALGLEQSVEITGFLDAPQVAARLTQALALLLPSREEQWGLVVNEALALGLPVIVSEAVGARDLLVRNLINGFVLGIDSPAGWAAAMAELGNDEARWRTMVAQSHALAQAGDVKRFAEAVEQLAGLAPGSSAPQQLKKSDAR